MKKNNGSHQGDSGGGSGAFQPISCPATDYLTRNNYHLVRDDRVFNFLGVVVEHKQTFLNEALGLAVVISLPEKTAQVSIAGGGPIVAALQVMYSDASVLGALLVDAAGLKVPNRNQSNH